MYRFCLRIVSKGSLSRALANRKSKETPACSESDLRIASERVESWTESPRSRRRDIEGLESCSATAREFTAPCVDAIVFTI